MPFPIEAVGTSGIKVLNTCPLLCIVSWTETSAHNLDSEVAKEHLCSSERSAEEKDLSAAVDSGLNSSTPSACRPTPLIARSTSVGVSLAV